MNRVVKPVIVTGHLSGHRSSLLPYTVTSLCMNEANEMKYTNSEVSSKADSCEINYAQSNDPVVKVYRYHWRLA
ncbi:MAG: hypothetical protein ACFFEF_13140 [Candidatus Thorarchaeota archaeon]